MKFVELYAEEYEGTLPPCGPVVRISAGRVVDPPVPEDTMYFTLEREGEPDTVGALLTPDEALALAFVLTGAVRREMMGASHD